MSTPEELKLSAGLALKLVKIMEAVDRVPKNGVNTHFGYKYATEADVADACRKAMIANRVALLVSTTDTSRVHEYTSRSGGQQVVWRADIDATFIDADTGAQFTVHAIGFGEDAGDKGIYKAITGALKYVLMKTFLIPTGDDPEADQNSSQGGAPGGQAKRVSPNQPTARQQQPAAPPAKGKYPPGPRGKPCTPAQVGKLEAMLRSKGFNPQQMQAWAVKNFNITSFAMLDIGHVDAAIARINAIQEPGDPFEGPDEGDYVNIEDAGCR